MNQILVLLFLSFINVKSQNISTSDSTELKPLHPSLAIVLGIIAIMLSVTFIILAYAKFCSTNTNQNVHDHASRFSGIDRTVIDSLPFFRFSSLKGSKEGLECAVCLSRFEDTEVLRFLPKCKHAFHINCIDQWLQSHSSCPLCRYRIDIKDLLSFTYSNSFRYLRNFSNLSEEPNLEIFVEREQDHQELLIHDGYLFHKFKHRIIVSDVIIKHRWSDVNSSDFLSLNSEMLGIVATNRFSPSNSTSARFYRDLSMDENMEKIKQDIEKKRSYESKIMRGPSKMIMNCGEKRSMSEIVICSRFKDLRNNECASPKEDRMKRLWLPIARRTVEWFAGSERNLLKDQDYKRQTLNVF
ncbi:putative RING-H2 finger protein ATL12 [Euphorbia lathyris]|uniref:putative RING-H2 finger protein ATL12 n=1 Tax=Euphorbia lathyris TaxID=212925 RepID=UPI0033137AEE